MGVHDRANELPTHSIPPPPATVHTNKFASGGQGLRPVDPDPSPPAARGSAPWTPTLREGPATTTAAVCHPSRTTGNQAAPARAMSFVRWGAPPCPGRGGPAGTSLHDGKTHSPNTRCFRHVTSTTVNRIWRAFIQPARATWVGIRSANGLVEGGHGDNCRPCERSKLGASCFLSLTRGRTRVADPREHDAVQLNGSPKAIAPELPAHVPT